MNSIIIILLLICISNTICSDGENYDTIVIGMGAAGTAAATALAGVGKRVLALEAQERIGGRIKTRNFGDGLVEEGGEWIHGESANGVNSPNFEAAIKNKIDIVFESQNSTVVYESDGSTERSYKLEQLMKYVLELRSIINEKELLGTFLTRKIKEYLNMHMPEIQNDQNILGQILDFTNLLIGTTEATNDWNDVFAQKTWRALDGQQRWSYHRYGYITFFEILLKTYNHGEGFSNLDIKLNSEVINIKIPDDSKEPVEVETRNGKVYRSQTVVLTASVGVLKERYKTLFTPPMSDDKIAALNMIELGVVDKIILSFPKCWWPENITISAFFWRPEDVEKIPERDRWITKLFYATKPLGANNVVTLWTIGDTAKYVESMSPETVKAKSVELLRMFMGKHIQIPDAEHLILSQWYNNPYTRGSCSFDAAAANITTVLTNARDILARPLSDASETPRVFFAGEAISIDHYCTVHGAAETGFKAATLIAVP